ncbi:hypothetical protein NECAME_17770, partial [Necator americanus]
DNRDRQLIFREAYTFPENQNAKSLGLFRDQFQATINSALYLSMLGLFCIADYLDDDTIKFFLTVIGWQLWLGATPYCIIVLQKEFQQPIRKLWRKIARRSEISGFQLTTEVISKFPTRHH